MLVVFWIQVCKCECVWGGVALQPVSCLQTTGKRLPEWGFKQLEAVTSKSAEVLSSLWFLEEVDVPGVDLSQRSAQSSGNNGSSEGQGEGSTGDSDGVSVARESVEVKSEGYPSTDSGGDAVSEAVELAGKDLLMPCVVLCSG